MGKLNWLYRQLNLLSLDVVAGVVICAVFFSQIFQVHIKPQGLVTLALTVWIIYTTDHLLDAHRIQGMASTERHRFHQYNFKLLCILLGISTIVNVILIFFIREVVFLWGLWLIGLVVVYLLFQKRLRFFKEFIAALLYSSGVMLPSLAGSHLSIDFSVGVLMVQFFLTALLNLMLFSWFDEEKDIQDKHYSFVTKVGYLGTKRFLLVIFSCQLILCLFQLVYRTPWIIPLCILMAMNSILLLILLYRKWFAQYDRFRLLGDAVFLFPILFILEKHFV